MCWRIQPSSKRGYATRENKLTCIYNHSSILCNVLCSETQCVKRKYVYRGMYNVTIAEINNCGLLQQRTGHQQGLKEHIKLDRIGHQHGLKEHIKLD